MSSLPGVVLAFLSTASLVSDVEPSAASNGSQTPASSSVAAPQLQDFDALIERLPSVACESRRIGAVTRFEDAALEMRTLLSRGAVLTDEQWRRLLTRTDAMRLPARWPVTQPLHVYMRVPGWLGATQIRATPKDATLQAASAGVLGIGSRGNCRMEPDWSQPLGSIGLGPQRIVFVVEIEHGEPARLDDLDEHLPLTKGILWRGEIALEVVVARGIDEAWPAVDSDMLRDAVRDSIGARVRRYSASSSSLELTVDPDIDRFPALTQVGLSLEIELRRLGETTETQYLPVPRLFGMAAMSSMRTTRMRFHAESRLDPFDAEVAVDPVELASWTLVVHGANRSMECLWDADSRWSGTVEVPLAEALERAKVWDAQAKR